MLHRVLTWPPVLVYHFIAALRRVRSVLRTGLLSAAQLAAASSSQPLAATARRLPFAAAAAALPFAAAAAALPCALAAAALPCAISASKSGSSQRRFTESDPRAAGRPCVLHAGRHTSIYLLRTSRVRLSSAGHQNG